VRLRRFGIASRAVHRKIHDDLLELTRVGLHAAASDANRDPDRHVLRPSRRRNSISSSRTMVVSRSTWGRHHLLAAEREAAAASTRARRRSGYKSLRVPDRPFGDLEHQLVVPRIAVRGC